MKKQQSKMTVGLYFQADTIYKKMEALKKVQRLLENSDESFVNPDVLDCMSRRAKQMHLDNERIIDKELQMILNYSKSLINRKICQLEWEFENLEQI